MIIYVANIFLLMFNRLLFLKREKSLSRAKIFVIFATIQWILISGLRHWSVGADTLAYKIYRFDSTLKKDWMTIWDYTISVIFRGGEGKDPGYLIFEKTFQIFSDNYQIYLITIGVIFTVSLGFWIYKNSRAPLLSFVIYSCLFFAFYSITGHRQTIATALVVLIGYEFIKKKKLLHFISITLIAFSIHKSSVVFFPFYFIAHFKITKIYLFSSVIVIVLSFIFRVQMMTVLGTIMGYEDYVDFFEGAGTWTFTFLFSIITIGAFLKYKKILSNNPQAAHFINAIIVAFFFIPLTYVDPSAMRVVQYYSLFIMLLIPEIVLSFRKNEITLVYFSGMSILLMLFIRTNAQYLFFWQ